MTGSEQNPSGAICVDLGTTNTRVWRVAADGTVLARAKGQAGVRDTARTGDSRFLREALRAAIAEVSEADSKTNDPLPRCVIAAGMITSSLGLLEIPHLPAPAGLAEIAAATGEHSFPDVCELPFLLVPGVRSGAVAGSDAAAISAADLMRGEETLCLGLCALGKLAAPATLLNLGSHWKTIRIDGEGRIAGSRTSLAGEMIHAVQLDTILADAVPRDRPETLDPEWVAAGMAEERRSGLARALFCVRLLQLAKGTAPEQRQAYLTGAFIAAELDALLASGGIGAGRPVSIAGSPALAAAWQAALAGHGIASIALDEDGIERAMLAGLLGILAARG